MRQDYQKTHVMGAYGLANVGGVVVDRGTSLSQTFVLYLLPERYEANVNMKGVETEEDEWADNPTQGLLQEVCVVMHSNCPKEKLQRMRIVRSQPRAVQARTARSIDI